jgi:hypothetical protein
VRRTLTEQALAGFIAVLAVGAACWAADPDAPAVPVPVAPSKPPADPDAPVVAVPLPAPAQAEDAGAPGLLDRLPFDLHGFIEGRAGLRTIEPVEEEDASILEGRLQLDAGRAFDRAALRAKADFYHDGVMDRAFVDLRELNASVTPVSFLDLKAGRQALTWGTGDLLFINDLFPKDWNSFFIGRDEEYLKAPSDALKVSVFSAAVNADLVYAPVFNGDRFISGDRLSYYNDGLGRVVGRDHRVHADRRDEFFHESEFHGRLWRNLGGYELAAYGYHGYWKTPGGYNPAKDRYTYPGLSAWGGSARGPLGRGIANVEFGWYDSRDDHNGRDPLVRNSEFRLLAGYEQELARDLIGGAQAYWERLAGYDAYRRGLPAGARPRDEDRCLLTLRLTRFLLNQNLRVRGFAYWSPTDMDAHIRPNVHYKLSDHWAAEVGANLFFGREAHTFFGQFEENANVYAAVRWSF